MQKTWKPTTAGILNIITCAIGFIGLLALAFPIFISIRNSILWGSMPHIGLGELGILLIGPFYVVLAVILPLLGGIYALKRRKWGLVLAGSITAIFVTFILGILSTVFIALSRDEFE